MSRSTFTLVDAPGKPVKITVTLADGRVVDLQPTGAVSRDEARVICGGIMNCMRAGLRADQFRHGAVLDERPPADHAFATRNELRRRALVEEDRS